MKVMKNDKQIELTPRLAARYAKKGWITLDDSQKEQCDKELASYIALRRSEIRKTQKEQNPTLALLYDLVSGKAASAPLADEIGSNETDTGTRKRKTKEPDGGQNA